TQLAEAEEKQKYGTSRADRETSYHLADFPVLTGEEEDWRFTPLHRLAGLALPKGDDNLLTGTPPAGTVSEHDGVSVAPVPRTDLGVRSAMIADDPTSAGACNSVQEATVLTRADNGGIAEPIKSSVEASAGDAAAQHIHVAAGANSKANSF